MFLYILLAVAVLLVIVLIVAARRPSAFHIERSITIAAPPERSFALVNDFHAWGGWSPWEKLDPAMQRTFGPVASGAGATYAWKGNSKAGEGEMTIEQSERPSRIVIRLEFLKPFAATNTATFAFAAVAGGTRVTWGLDGRFSFVPKVFSLVMNMEKMIGSDFERGLAAMKTLAEKAA